jgi:hypothetical protein
MKNSIEVLRPTPILNIPEFHKAFGGRDGVQIPKNSQGHPLHFEFVALPGIRFIVEEILPRHHHCIYRVSSTAYPSAKLYVDGRFVRPGNGIKKTIPSARVIINRMEALVGKPYIHGGNWSQGIPELLHLYPPRGALDEKTKLLWTLQGVDSAGLLYEATDGSTPRKISRLLHFGTGLAAEQPDELLDLVRPLDFIAWPHHIAFVVEAQQIIESTPTMGVVKRDLKQFLKELCHRRKGVTHWDTGLDPTKFFVVRRLPTAPLEDVST